MTYAAAREGSGASALRSGADTLQWRRTFRGRSTLLRGRFILAACLVLGGVGLAAWVQTNGGTVAVRDIRFAGADGGVLSGYLYVPDGASESTPAPAVLAVHGYINSRETQSGFAIELARRGFVVLALDQTGHGYSDPPAFAAGFGGPDALAYLRSLPFVDSTRIGLEGPSMGGWAVQMAAAAHPEGYAAMVLQGSSTGTFGAPAGTPEVPKNLAVVFSRFDEFSELMWGAPVPADIVGTEKLKSLFGTDETVEIGRMYGDPAAGTARWLAMPPVTHPGDHHSTEAIGEAIRWLELTLAHRSGLAPSSQVWYWKELGTLVALLGLVLMIFPLVDRLLGSSLAAVITPPSTPVRHSKPRLAANVAVMVLIPVIAFFPLQILGNLVLPPNLLLPQQITNGVLVWAWGTGLVSLGLFAIWFRNSERTLTELGVPLSASTVRRAAMLAIACCGALYLVVVAAQFFLNVDFRFWVVALKALSPHQFPMFLLYLPLFTLFFLVLSVVMHSQLPRLGSLRASMWVNGLVLSGGFVLLLVIQYLPLLAGATLAIPSQPLLTIVAFQFVPLLLLVGLVSTYCFARTSNVYTGAFINGLLVTWYMVAGTATQAVPFWMP